MSYFIIPNVNEMNKIIFSIIINNIIKPNHETKTTSQLSFLIPTFTAMKTRSKSCPNTLVWVTSALLTKLFLLSLVAICLLVLTSINEFVSGPSVHIENHKKFSRKCKCFIKSIRGPRKLKVGPFSKILATNGGGVEGTG